MIEEHTSSLAKAVRELRSRLQFVIVLALFFPVVLESMYKAAGTDNVSATIILQWGLLVAFLILSYLLLETIKERLQIKFVKLLDRLLLVQIAVFIPVLYVFAEGATKDHVSLLHIVPFTMAMHGMLWIPVILFLMLFLYWIATVGEEIAGDLPQVKKYLVSKLRK